MLTTGGLRYHLIASADKVLNARGGNLLLYKWAPKNYFTKTKKLTKQPFNESFMTDNMFLIARLTNTDE